MCSHVIFIIYFKYHMHAIITQAWFETALDYKPSIFIECKLITTQFFVFTYVHLELPIIEAFENHFLVIFLTKKKFS